MTAVRVGRPATARAVHLPVTGVCLADRSLDATKATLEGRLVIPAEAQGVVLFAHGSGSSRFSARNRFVADRLYERGLGTLLFDLLTAKEEAFDLTTHQLRFDIPLLAGRLVAALAWLAEQPEIKGLSLGCFGASTGAAAALAAAARRPGAVRAVVSRGGRPDLARVALARVRAPTLFIVGGADDAVLALNRGALTQLSSEKRLEVVPGATHLFEELEVLGQVANLAGDWFLRHLANED